jgi:hypothetical protein
MAVRGSIRPQVIADRRWLPCALAFADGSEKLS